MAGCQFSFGFSGDRQDLLKEIENGFRGAGGTVEVNGTEGQFSIGTPLGDFGGSFSVDDQTIRIDVDNKPVFVPCSVIESQLKKFVSGSKWT